MKFTVTVSGLGKWSGPIQEDGDRLVLKTGVHELETDDPISISGLVSVHMAYRMHKVGVVVKSDDPAWTKLVQRAEERETADQAAAAASRAAEGVE